MAISNTVIQLKKSANTGNAPTALANGELALNYVDGKLYYKNSSGNISYFYGQNNGPSFATANANNNLILATNPNDTLSFTSANGISITACTTSKTINVGQNYINIANGQSIVNYNGGLGNQQAVTVLSGANTKGGIGYVDFLQANNQSDGSANTSKWFRLDSNGQFQIINSTYTTNIFNLSDAGILSVPSMSSLTLTQGGGGSITFADGTIQATAASGAATDSYARSTANSAAIYANGAFAQANGAFTTANNALPNTGSVITVNSSSQLIISNTLASTSNSTGALLVSGGIGVTGNINVYGANSFFANNVNVGGTLSASNAVFSNSSFTLQDSTDPTKQAKFLLSGLSTGNTTVYTLPAGSANTSTLVDLITTQTINGAKTFSGIQTFSSATQNMGSSTANSTQNFAYGATIAGALKTVNIGTGGVVGSNTVINIGTSSAGNTTVSFGTNTIVKLINTISSITNTSGALIISGGVGISGNIYSGGLYITGSGNGITFVDGTTQTTSSTSAGTYANGAFIQANAAFLTANTPDYQSNSSAIYANGAFVQANASFTVANTWTSYSQTANNTANTYYISNGIIGIFPYANAAYAQANAAFLVANTPNYVANSAAIYANGAFNQANASFAESNSAASYANSSFSVANSAAIYANGAFARANNSLNANNGGTVTGTIFVSTGTGLSLNTTGPIVVGGDITVNGNLNLSGNANTYSSNTLSVSDPMIYLAANNTADAVDIGFVGHFIGTGSSGFSHYQHTGIVRDYTDRKWKLFSNVSNEPTTTVTFDANTIYDTLKVGTIEAATSNINGYDLLVYSNASFAVANSASIYANGAFIQANASFAESNSAASYANSGFSVANSAAIYANGAFIQANAVFTRDNAAFIQANAAFLTANTPNYVANSAAIYANGAFNQANGAFTTANNAFTSSNGAIAWSTANSAGSYANSAFSVANNALANTGSLITSNGTSQILIANTQASTSNTTGALVIKGGLGVQGNVYSTNNYVLNDVVAGLQDGVALGGATNPIIAAIGNTDNYIQSYQINYANTANASSDFVAYPNNGNDSNGWIDMGITSNAYTQAIYSVTGRNEGYLFMSAPGGSGTSGNLVIATDSTGVYNSIEFYLGGFNTAKGTGEFTIRNISAATSTTNGTIQVAGGIAASGNAYSGNVYTNGLFYAANGLPYATGSSVKINNDTSNSATQYVVFSSQFSGTLTNANTSNSGLTFVPSTGTLGATIFQSLSDENQKTNIRIIDNAMDITDNLRGVTFDWKENGLPSAGLIAQDVEKYLPQLINSNGESKTLNYNGIIGVLVEAIKEQNVLLKDLNQRVKDLESKE